MLLLHRHHYHFHCLQMRLTQVLIQTSSKPNNVCLLALPSYRTTSYCLYLAQMVRCNHNYYWINYHVSEQTDLFFLILLILFAHILILSYLYFQSILSYFGNQTLVVTSFLYPVIRIDTASSVLHSSKRHSTHNPHSCCRHIRCFYCHNRCICFNGGSILPINSPSNWSSNSRRIRFHNSCRN